MKQKKITLEEAIEILKELPEVTPDLKVINKKTRKLKSLYAKRLEELNK